MKPPTQLTVADAAATLRQILVLVEEGTLDATSGQAVALVRRLEGAAAALEIAAGSEGPAESAGR